MEKNVLFEIGTEFIRSDLACECAAISRENLGEKGYREQTSEEGFELIKAEIKTAADEEKTGKPRGRYLTVLCGKISELDDIEAKALSRCIAREIREFVRFACKRADEKQLCVLIAGLGNAKMTPDAIGPEAVSRLTATNHIASIDPELFDSLGCARLCAFSPGVLGDTGIESVELIRGAAKGAGADVAVVIDALASRSSERLAATVQISDSGITPGAGVGNRRSEISERTLGIPVIALGIPTVIDCATIVFDALGEREVDENTLALLRGQKSFFVAPKECDEITRRAACVIADAIDTAFGIKRAQEPYIL